MQEIKYFYNNQPLTAYCKEHDINPDTIRTRIWKLRRNPKYSHLKDEEIIDMVIAAYGSGIKYMYGDMTLRQYCLKNDLNFGTIISRINNLKKQFPALSNDEIVVLAIDEFQNHNYTLFYHGIPLKDYCLEHQEVNYNTIRAYITREKSLFPSKTTDEIVDEYLKKEHFGRWRYYYCGIPLREYCEEQGIKYSNVLARIRRYQKSHTTSSLDELVNIIMNKYEPFAPKYMYHDMTLNKYCEQNDISYYSVVSFVKRKLAKDSSCKIDDLIDEAIKTIKKQGIIYYYQGMPLRDYCKIHNLNASSIRATILRYRGKYDYPLQEIVNHCVDAYNGFKIKYFYEGEPLYSYCKKNKINYNTVISRYLDMDVEDIEEQNNIIKRIVDDIRSNPHPRTKYFFLEQSLRKYCQDMNYSYSAIYQRIRKYREEFTYTLDTEIVAEAVLTYEEKNILKQNYQLFNNLEDNDEIPLSDICTKLNINFSSLLDMQELGFISTQAITIIWLIGIGDNKYINDEILKNLYTFINMYKKGEVLDIYVLYVLYKSCICDTSVSIMIYFKSYIIDIINTYQEHYRNLTSTETNILWDEINSYILMLLDYIYLDNKEKFIHHMMYLISEKIRNTFENMTKEATGPTLKKSFT